VVYVYGKEWRRLRMSSVRFLSGVVMLALAAIVNPASAVLVDDVQGQLDAVKWYYGATDQFQVTNPAGSGPASINTFTFSTTNSTGTEYWLFGGTFSIQPSSLVADLTAINGGLAKGVFAAGATMTISGELLRDSDFSVAASGDLIVASIAGQWTLEEMASPPYPSNTVRGQALFDITGGLLSSGALNPDGIVLNDFFLNFTFGKSTPAVTDFATTAETYACATPNLQFTPVPEPASILLIGLGAASILRRRRNL
jgi:hypothetical protein